MEKTEKGLYCIAVLRILVGWLLLWAFLDKMFGLGFKTPHGMGVIDGVSPSSFVLFVTRGIFKDFYDSLAGNMFVDILMMLGLLVLGVTLILGITSKLSTVGISAFLLIMFSLHIPPEDNPLLDFRFILMFGMVGAYYLGCYERLSVYSWWKDTWLVKRFPILE